MTIPDKAIWKEALKDAISPWPFLAGLIFLTALGALFHG